MCKKIILFFCLIFIFQFSHSQKIIDSSNDTGKLPWVTGDLPNNTLNFSYKVIMGENENLLAAKKNAIQNLVFELGTEIGVNISSETVTKVQEKIINQSSFVSSDFQETIKIQQNGVSAKFSKIDEYYELINSPNGSHYYRVWHLYSIGENSNLTPKINYTSKYGWRTGLKSAIVPGWGQFHKKDKKKGFIFITAAVASTGAFIYNQNEYNNNINRLEESSSLEIQKEYSKRADEFNSYKNISLGAMAVVWIWSVIDAVSTDGAPKYANNNFGFSLKSYQNQSIAFQINYIF